MDIAGRVRVLIARVRAKTWRQLVRATAFRLWPLSLLARAYYHLRWTEWGRAVLNRRLVAAFRAEPSTTDVEQTRCVSDLRRDGICLSTLQQLVGEPLFRRLEDEVRSLLAEPSLQQQIADRQARLGEKWYVIRALGYDSRYTLPDAMAQVILHPRVLAVVNQYLGMYSRLCYANLWYNLPVEAHERSIDSEHWHRDHEDRSLVKLYVYLCDVDEDMGPLEYLRGTHPDGPYGELLPAQAGAGRYPTETQLIGSIPATAATLCVGPIGTLIFCDSAGFHRGGRSQAEPRIVVTATYVTDSSVDRRTFDLAVETRVDLGDEAVRHALRRERRITRFHYKT